MNRKLFEEVTGGDWLSRAELDGMRKERMGEGLDTIEEEWMNLLRFSYTMEQFDSVKEVGELGATTTVVVLYFAEDELECPDLGDELLFGSMMGQGGEIGNIAKYIFLDDSLSFDGGGVPSSDEKLRNIGVWT